MKKVPKFLLRLVAFSALAISVPFTVAIYQRLRAASFLREFVALPIGTATFADAQQLAAKYGAKSSGIRLGDACSAQDCAFAFVFKNWLFNHVQHKREISLAGGLNIKDGRLVSRELDYSILAKSADAADHQFMYILFDRLAPETDKGYTVRQGKVNANGLAHDTEVDLGSNTPDDVRKHAFSVDLSCLSRFAGCESSSDVLPRDRRDLGILGTDGTLP